MNYPSRISRFFFRKKFIITMLIIIISSTLLLFTFRSLGVWLTVADQLPKRLDIICTFAGDSHRVTYSKKLMKYYQNAHWFLSDYKNGYARLLRKNNFPMNRVKVVDTTSNTLSEINACKVWIDSLLGASPATTTQLHVGLISSPYHMRRINIMAKKRMNNPAIRYYLLPVPMDRYKWTEKSYRHWWRSRSISTIVVTELSKIFYYYLTGYFR
jgi:uncharacterized SAM-binding protein YcdF (DUF218 family)